MKYYCLAIVLLLSVGCGQKTSTLFKCDPQEPAKEEQCKPVSKVTTPGKAEFHPDGKIIVDHNGGESFWSRLFTGSLDTASKIAIGRAMDTD